MYQPVISPKDTLAIQAAPSIEACPPDSVLNDDECICDPESCVQPPCLSALSVVVNASDVPGSCCPIYDCVDCRNDTLIDGKCPCAPEAVLNSKNQCHCVDEEKHLVKGVCVCNPLQCELPPLCDKKSVAVTIDDGCCKKTICKPCPSDSESTQLETEDLDDHCVCLPCKKECGNNRIAVVKKYGLGFPGNCCDLYECKGLDEVDGCRVEDMVYQNGEEWLTVDEQKCKCQNGLSLCSKIIEEKSLSCVEDHKIYKHLDKWIKEDGCTYCTCMNGEEKCISHFCEVKESQIQKNETQSCFKDDAVYQHLDTWTEKDGCTYCTCLNGVEECSTDFCEKEPIHKKDDCQPLANCNRTCTNGFKINKKGCEICKCNSVKVTQNILLKYNITMKDLIAIVEDYMHQRTSTSTTSTSTPVTPLLVEVINTSSSGNGDANAKFFKEILVTSTTTEPSVVPTDTEAGYWNVAIPILVLLVFACVVFIIVIVTCIYKRRRRSSMDLFHPDYKTVNSLDNNNTIKNTDPLL
ncbi:cysteine-rich motor neuron 1 protein-like [Anoplophora glabripennis]|uniref:cysteine-rich motor neuron 1 protein-like n=1 Tax=Anoplophora glabripennis TaxID=217634 RepID=UPI000C7848D1|nr:cysteine-rich motor neuron 1 protein-like [Anoplophora glabripennis]